ncbi:hypothetical protein MYX65_00665 [Acidobacteria bacterium AH-259-L09]|nr:hypothetical protein [Acidobacteria bacterium AH-259-L09]
MSDIVKREETGIVERGETGLSKPAKTYVAFVLDRSGSMEAIRKEVVEGFNQQVRLIKQQTDGMEVRVSLMTFSTYADPPIFMGRQRC